MPATLAAQGPLAVPSREQASTAPSPCPCVSLPCRDISVLHKLNCYWFFCRYFLFALVTFVALLASPIVMWLDPWVWGFPTIYFLVSANLAVPVYWIITGLSHWVCLLLPIMAYVFLLFSVVRAMRVLQPTVGL